MRAPVGTRIEETTALFDHVENRIRQVIPPDQLSSIIDNIGLPVSGQNRAYLNTGGVGPEDGDILISLNKGHAPTASFVKDLRTTLPQSFPGSTFSFLPADIVSQILNFGSPAPIDVQVSGGFAQVSLGIPGAAAMLRLPAGALMFRAAGLQVATLGPQNRIVMKSIVIGTDLRTTVIVSSGLSPRDRVVNNRRIRCPTATG